MRAVVPAGEADDVALRQDVLALVRTQRRLAPQHDHPLLVRVMGVERPVLVAGRDLGHARAEQLAADAVADESLLDAPPLALARFVPLVAVEVEDLHRCACDAPGSPAGSRRARRREPVAGQYRGKLLPPCRCGSSSSRTGSVGAADSARVAAAVTGS